MTISEFRFNKINEHNQKPGVRSDEKNKINRYDVMESRSHISILYVI